MVAQGALAAQFSDLLENYTQLPGGALTSSGSAGITLVLRALGLARAGEVILPTYVCRSVGDAVADAGLTPVLCDAGHDWNLSAQTVEQVFTPRTVAIVAPHVFGILSDIDGLKQFGVPVIEDACQAFGTVHGEPIGLKGTVSVFSFNATKCLTTGEGGYAASQDEAISARMLELAHGSEQRFNRIFSPMTDMQAALGISQLAAYPTFLERRNHLAARYFEALAGMNVTLPTHVRSRSMFFRFPLLVKDQSFSEVQDHFQSRGIAVRRGVDALLHRMIGESAAKFPVAERLFAETVSIPLYPALTDDEQSRVISACHELWANK